VALPDRWTLLIMREACHGMRPFEEFQRTRGIGRNSLTLRLNTLVDDGTLTKVQYQERPVRYEYRLTDKGPDLSSILAAMAAFGDRSLLANETSRPPRHLQHAGETRTRVYRGQRAERAHVTRDEWVAAYADATAGVPPAGRRRARLWRVGR
jgi:DNA-binding HxlR family transcriptional regulator